MSGTTDLKDRELLLLLLDKVDTLSTRLNTLMPLVPEWISLSDIANTLETNKIKATNKTNTLRKYIIANFTPEEQFKKKGGKILVKRDVVLLIRRHYESR